MVTCDEFLQNISDFVEGYISEEQKKTISVHLKQCPVCAQIISDIQLISIILRKLPKKAASQTFEERLRQKLAKETAQQQDIDQLFLTLRFLPYKPVFGSIAAAAAIAFIVISINSYIFKDKTPEQLPISPRLEIPPFSRNQQGATVTQPLYSRFQTGLASRTDTSAANEDDFKFNNLSQSLRNRFLQVTEQKH